MNHSLESLSSRDEQIINNWYIACLSKELKNSPIQRTIYDQKLVLFRDQSNKAFCLIDRCPHRGTPLSKGQCVKEGLQCSYHGWTLNGDGTVVNIPSEGEKEDKAKRSIKSFSVHEQEGVIWVWMGDKDPTGPDSIWKFKTETDKNWHGYFMVTDFENEVTNLVENFVDVPHTVWVHKGWFRNRGFQKVPAEVETNNGKMSITYHQPNDNIGVLIKPLLNPTNEPMKHIDQFIYPNITNVIYSFGKRFSYIINSQCTPVSTFKTRVYTYIGYKVPLIGFLIEPFLKFYTRKVIEQDVVIMRHQQENLKFEPNPKFQSTEADEPHIQIERLRKIGKSDQAKVFEIKKNRTINFYI